MRRYPFDVLSHHTVPSLYCYLCVVVIKLDCSVL